MAKYKIDLSASGDASYYHVRKALGPWPFMNWSWGPVFTSRSRLEAEAWIRGTQFTESEEGQRLALEAEHATLAKREAAEKEHRELITAGWVWDAACCWYRNLTTGEVRCATYG